MCLICEVDHSHGCMYETQMVCQFKLDRMSKSSINSQFAEVSILLVGSWTLHHIIIITIKKPLQFARRYLNRPYLMLIGIA